MPKKLESLTPEQAAILPRKRDEWLAVGLCTDPIDLPRFKAGMAKAFAVIGKPAPQTVIVLPSWRACNYAASVVLPAIFKDGAKQQAVDVSPGVSGITVDRQVQHDLWQQVVEQVGSKVGQRVAYAISDEVRAQPENYEYARFWNQFEAGWLSFYDTMAALGIDTSKLNGLMEMARSAGPAWLWWDVALVCDRPGRISLDARGRLHHESAAAVLYRDGWGVHAWHGVRVPEYVIARPHEITVEKIGAEQNAEIKRVMIERFGHGRYIAESGLKAIQSDDYGTLYRHEDVTVVRVIDQVKNDDGSEKVHYLPVNTELRPMRLNEETGSIDYGEPQALTARNAIASTFGLRGEEYAPAVET